MINQWCSFYPVKLIFIFFEFLNSNLWYTQNRNDLRSKQGRNQLPILVFIMLISNIRDINPFTTIVPN